MSKKNKIKMVAKGLTGITAGLLMSQSIYAANPFSTVAQKFKNIFSTGDAKIFSAADIKEAASAEFEVKSARLITDNDEAFQSKLAMVQSAKESIKMIYFIYSVKRHLYSQEVYHLNILIIKFNFIILFQN
jgi:exopolysaccharide biosynthesis protein